MMKRVAYSGLELKGGRRRPFPSLAILGILEAESCAQDT